MSLRTQAKVRRALEEQRLEPVGAGGSVQVDVRVVAATNKNLGRGNRARQFSRRPVLPPERDPYSVRLEGSDNPFARFRVKDIVATPESPGTASTIRVSKLPDPVPLKYSSNRGIVRHHRKSPDCGLGLVAREILHQPNPVHLLAGFRLNSSLKRTKKPPGCVRTSGRGQLLAFRSSPHERPAARHFSQLALVVGPVV